VLERQQFKLVAGLRKLYCLLQKKEEWPGPPLQELSEGFPLTHDILERLGVLHYGVDLSVETGVDEELGRKGGHTPSPKRELTINDPPTPSDSVELHPMERQIQTHQEHEPVPYGQHSCFSMLPLLSSKDNGYFSHNQWEWPKTVSNASSFEADLSCDQQISLFSPNSNLYDDCTLMNPHFVTTTEFGQPLQPSGMYV